MQCNIAVLLTSRCRECKCFEQMFAARLDLLKVFHPIVSTGASVIAGESLRRDVVM